MAFSTEKWPALKRLGIATSATFLDQLAVSSVQFFTGMIFIYKGTPEEYGLFSFYMAVTYGVASLQNSVINTPMMVITPRLPPGDAHRFETAILGFFLILILPVAAGLLVSGSLFAKFVQDKGITPGNLVAFTGAILFLSMRNFWRAREYANLQPVVSFKRDAVYALISIVLMGLFILGHAFKTSAAFIFMGIAAFLVTGPLTLKRSVPFPGAREIIDAAGKSWAIARWSLIGAAGSWLQGQAFVFIPFFITGVREVAFLSAARLMMMPPALVSNAWSNYLRPVVSKKLSHGRHGSAMRFTVLSTLLLIVLLMAYTALLLVLLLNLPSSLVPEDYRHIDSLIILWAAVIFVKIIRSNISSFYQASLAFRSLAMQSIITAAITVAATLIFVMNAGEMGALYGRFLGEMVLVMLLLSCFKARNDP